MIRRLIKLPSNWSKFISESKRNLVKKFFLILNRLNYAKLISSLIPSGNILNWTDVFNIWYKVPPFIDVSHNWILASNWCEESSLLKLPHPGRIQSLIRTTLLKRSKFIRSCVYVTILHVLRVCWEPPCHNYSQIEHATGKLYLNK